MSLRIIGGLFRNRLLTSPKSEKTRPTLAIMRKAVFDILQSQVEDIQFLDLYAGSGAMGLEALSRGAAHVTFVESNRFALNAIHENCRTLKVEEQCTLVNFDCKLALKKFAKEEKHFDIVYVDPPYIAAGRLIEEILSFFDTHPLLNPGGVLFLEEAAPPLLNPKTLALSTLHHVDTRTFSRSTLHQFRMKVKVQS